MIEIRLEKEIDHRIVEELTKEAFWNVYVQGCNEHFFLHILRKSYCFIPELNFVALIDSEIVGNIVYTKSQIVNTDKTHDVISFGPIAVLPKFQKCGVGTALIEHSAKVAMGYGYKAIVIYGDPDYYCKRGFRCSKDFNISRADGKYAAALQAMELGENALKDIDGKFVEDPIFVIGAEQTKEFEEFDKTFPKKEKFVTETQKRFDIISNKLC